MHIYTCINIKPNKQHAPPSCCIHGISCAQANTRLRARRGPRPGGHGAEAHVQSLGGHQRHGLRPPGTGDDASWGLCGWGVEKRRVVKE